MKDGDFIRVDYVGRIKESGEIFDVTREEVAKENGVHDSKFKYGPVPVIIGSNFVIKGLEKELREMKVGEKKNITVNSKDGFGERSEKLIRLIPIAEFQKQNIDPFPGMPIMMSNIAGKVISVSGGRVKVDFNHPLAGKELEYDIEVKNEIKNDDDKVKAMIELFIKDNNSSVKIDGDVAEILINSDVHRPTKETIAETVKKWVSSVKKVKFIEEF